MIVEASGGPLGVVIDGANVHDTKLLQATIEAIVVERPRPTPEEPQNLCLDNGYDKTTGRQAAVDRRYTPYIRRIGEEKAARAWEATAQATPLGRRTHAWLACQMPRDSRSVRQERIQLSRPDSIRLCPALVPPRSPLEHRIAVLR